MVHRAEDIPSTHGNLAVLAIGAVETSAIAEASYGGPDGPSMGTRGKLTALRRGPVFLQSFGRRLGRDAVAFPFLVLQRLLSIASRERIHDR